MNTIKVSKLLVRECRPILIGSHDSAVGNRIGGNPPAEVSPVSTMPWIRYFATLQATEDPPTELSLFFTAKAPSDILKQSFHLMRADCGPIQLIFHPAGARTDNSPFTSELSGHPLIIQDPMEDIASEGAPDHKLGGVPYYHHGYLKSVLNETQKALDSGYFHFLQLSLPGSRHARVTGNWPFGEYMFHLFAKESGEGWEFLYGWA